MATANNTTELKDFVITREFNAPRNLVWKTWTEKSHIEKWGSPQGFTMTCKKFEFKVGGENHYCQKTSDGHETWGKQKYLEIHPTHKLVYLQSFADENENIIAHPMSATWPLQMRTTIILEEKNNKTLLTLTWTPYEASAEGIATFNSAMDGMSKGWAGSFAKFDEYLVEIQKDNSNGAMEFLVNLETKTTTIKREFASPLPLVWDAFTKPEILDQWWAPKPFESRTKSMNFEVGGRRFYAMVTPEGQERWAIQKYISISPKTNFKMYNTFADKEENPELPGSEWDFNFSEQNGKTTVSISIYNESRERMEKMIEMGFKEGITATLNELENLLKTLS